MKIIGSLLILCSSFLASYFYEKSEKEKASACSDVCDFIMYIKAQIEYFKMPTDKIFASYKTESKIVTALATRDYKYIFSVFDDNVAQVLEKFRESLGAGFKDEQLSLCEYTIYIVSERGKKLNNEFSGKVRVFRSLALFCSVCAIILLV